MNSELESNTRGITRSKANDEDLSSSMKNFPLRHAISKVPEGSLYINFLDNELNSTGNDRLKEGHNFSHIMTKDRG